MGCPVTLPSSAQLTAKPGVPLIGTAIAFVIRHPLRFRRHRSMRR
jgi:hypothetical protein